MCVGRNLLRPAGVQLQPATFNLKVFYAEDLPRSELNVIAPLQNFLRILLTLFSSGLHVFIQLQTIRHIFYSVLYIHDVCINYIVCVL